jgi:uncharacterized protein
MEEGDINVDADAKQTTEDIEDDVDDADDVEYDLDAPGETLHEVPDRMLLNLKFPSDDPDLSEEELKKRAAARARAIMARKKREAAAFDDQVAGERSRVANVTGK